MSNDFGFEDDTSDLCTVYRTTFAALATGACAALFAIFSHASSTRRNTSCGREPSKVVTGALACRTMLWALINTADLSENTERMRIVGESALDL